MLPPNNPQNHSPQNQPQPHQPQPHQPQPHQPQPHQQQQHQPQQHQPQPHQPQQHQYQPHQPHQPHQPQPHQPQPHQPQPHQPQPHQQHQPHQPQPHQPQPHQPQPHQPQPHQQHQPPQHQPQPHQPQPHQPQPHQQQQHQPPKETTPPTKKETPRRSQQTLLQAGSILSFWAEAADLILTCNNGDAALLYFHILRKGHGFPEGWDGARTNQAQNVLDSLGLYDASQCANPAPQKWEPLPSSNAPTYTTNDLVMRSNDKSNGFSDLIDRTAMQFGNTLSSQQQKTLLELFEHVGLSPQMITMLVTSVISRYQQTYGKTHLPNMQQIKKEGYRWQKLGISTIDSAKEYMLEQYKLSYWEADVLSCFKIHSRELTETERENCHQWHKWGFDEAMLCHAYEKTVESLGNFKWAYCRKILSSWQEKGFKTLKEVKEKDNNFASKPSGQKITQTQNGPRMGQPSQTAPSPNQSQYDARAQKDMEILLRSLSNPTDPPL